MAAMTRLRLAFNRLLKVANLELTTLTAKTREDARLSGLARTGLFDRPAYALTPGMEAFDPAPLAAAWERYGPGVEALKQPGNAVGYVYAGNDYYRTPDMEVLYLLVRDLKPRRIIEIGCGSSTRISRQAIRDGGLETKIIAIDPSPRNDIAPLVDRFVKTWLEEVDLSLFDELEPGDFLFIDSSHEVRVGNDVALLFSAVIPRLKPGVIVHVHDIFLPFEYPEPYLNFCKTWGEQYVLHALLQSGGHDLIWPGHYVWKMRPDLHETLPFLKGSQMAQSFWFRVG